MRNLVKTKPFEYYLNQVKGEFPRDKILQEIHAIRLKLSEERKAEGFSLEEWSRKVGKKAMLLAKKYKLEMTSIL